MSGANAAGRPRPPPWRRARRVGQPLRPALKRRVHEGGPARSGAPISMALGPTRMVCGPRPGMYGSGPWPGHAKRKRGKNEALAALLVPHVPPWFVPQGTSQNGAWDRKVAILRGPWPGACAGRARAQAGKSRERCATLLFLLYSPPRLVPAPGVPTERQRRAVRACRNALKRGTKEALFENVPRQEMVRSYSPMPMHGARPAASAAVGKRGRLPKSMHGRAGTGEGIYRHRLQRCRWPKHGPGPVVWP